ARLGWGLDRAAPARAARNEREVASDGIRPSLSSSTAARRTAGEARTRARQARASAREPSRGDRGVQDDHAVQGHCAAPELDGRHGMLPYLPTPPATRATAEARGGRAVTCPELMLLSQPLGGGLAPAEAASLRSHIDTCAACHERLGRLERAAAQWRTAVRARSPLAARRPGTDCLAPGRLAGWVARAVPLEDVPAV